MRKNGVYMAIMLVAVMCVVGFGRSLVSSNASYSAQLTAQNEQITLYQNAITVLKNSQATSDREIVQAATGLDQARLRADEEAINDFLNIALTWSTIDEYNQSRQALMTKYHLGEYDSKVLTVFMPPLNTNTATDMGQLKGRSVYRNMLCRVYNASGDQYDYFVLATAAAVGAGGNTDDYETAWLFSVNADGIMNNVQAYTLV